MGYSRLIDYLGFHTLESENSIKATFLVNVVIASDGVTFPSLPLLRPHFSIPFLTTLRIHPTTRFSSPSNFTICVLCVY